MGPPSGWVSTHIGGKDVLVKNGSAPEKCVHQPNEKQKKVVKRHTQQLTQMYQEEAPAPSPVPRAFAMGRNAKTTPPGSRYALTLKPKGEVRKIQRLPKVQPQLPEGDVA